MGILPCVQVPSTNQPSTCCGLKVPSVFKAFIILFGDLWSVCTPVASVDRGSGLPLSAVLTVYAVLFRVRAPRPQLAWCIQEFINNLMCLLSMCLPQYLLVTWASPSQSTEKEVGSFLTLLCPALVRRAKLQEKWRKRSNRMCPLGSQLLCRNKTSHKLIVDLLTPHRESQRSLVLDLLRGKVRKSIQISGFKVSNIFSVNSMGWKVWSCELQRWVKTAESGVWRMWASIPLPLTC